MSTSFSPLFLYWFASDSFPCILPVLYSIKPPVHIIGALPPLSLCQGEIISRFDQGVSHRPETLLWEILNFGRI